MSQNVREPQNSICFLRLDERIKFRKSFLNCLHKAAKVPFSADICEYLVNACHIFRLAGAISLGPRPGLWSANQDNLKIKQCNSLFLYQIFLLN